MKEKELAVVASNANTIVYTIVEIETVFQLSVDVWNQWIVNDVISPVAIKEDAYVLDELQLKRLQTALRLQRDFEMTPPALALVLDLLEERVAMQAEMTWMQRHLLRK